MVVEAAILEIEGEEKNISEISKKEFHDLLSINRQQLGTFPQIFQNIAERDKIISTVGPLLLELCRAGKFGKFVSLLAAFLTEENAFNLSFLPPLTLHMRESRPGKNKRILNSNFQKAFKYFSLYFGGCVMKSEVQNSFIENLRQKYNVKVQNYKSAHKGFKQLEDFNPLFTVENAFEATVSLDANVFTVVTINFSVIKPPMTYI
uniref:Uncharacterized protein n=1 Tax=Panagrolaimus sp. ES5 TaxID=591445 RepID=A0AC34G4V9_9BILA